MAKFDVISENPSVQGPWTDELSKVLQEQGAFDVQTYQTKWAGWVFSVEVEHFSFIQATIIKQCLMHTWFICFVIHTFVWLYCTGLILRVSFPCTLCTITIHITIHRPKTSLSATNAPPCGSLSLRVYPSPMPGDIPLRMPHTGHCGYFDIFYGCFAGFRGPIWCSN